MRVVGLDLVAEYAARASEQDATRLRSWLYEVRHRSWRNLTALKSDYSCVDISNPPCTAFVLASAPVRIESIIDFKRGLLVVTAVKPTLPDLERSMQGRTQ